MAKGEERDGVELTNLDVQLFDGAEATKRDLIDYLDAVSARMLPGLRDRPLSVMRVRPGQPPFMQKNLPKYAPDWIRTEAIWAEASKREVHYPVCDDKRTLLWFGNQRAVEYHAQLYRSADDVHQTHLVLDLDPPEGAGFDVVVQAAFLVRQALADTELEAAVKTSGSKGVHILVPLADALPFEDVAAATRALAVRAEKLGPEIATTAFIREDREGRCSSTRRERAARPSWRPTHPGSGRACRSPPRWPGTTWSRSPRPTSRSRPRSPTRTCGRR